MSLRVERSNGLCRVTLARPDKRNALDESTRRGLADLAHDLADEPATRVVVLAADGPSFSAGVDLTAARGGDGSWAARRHASGAWQRTLDAWEALPQVTVAALQGHCIGGGALLAASCDLRVADPTLQVRIPELAIGIPLTWAGVPRLAREIGLPLTRDLVLTGRVMAADEALRCGFVQRLGELGSSTQECVDELLAMPAAPLAMTKAMTRALGQPAMNVAWADADLLHWSRAEPEGQDAAAAYVERRLGKRST
jgi:enoyl-CoA hydratase/carnithine racemase